jgi:hypothetical protein
MISKTQLRMLKDIARDNEPTDYAEFYNRSGTAGLAWGNRERVVNALIRGGLLDDELKVTERGLQVLDACVLEH